MFVYRLTTADGATELVRASIRLLPGLAAVDDYLTLDVRADRQVGYLDNRLFANDLSYTQYRSIATFEIVTPPQNGSISLTSGYAYVPNLGFRGRDQFTYRISDGHATAEGTAYIDVSFENQRPIAAPMRSTPNRTVTLRTRPLPTTAIRTATR